MWFVSRLFLVVALLAAGPAFAQKNGKPGDFDYYVLTLSWSPTFCAGGGEASSDPQCRSGRPYAFVLHGLWPQYDKGWPEFCRTKQRPWVPDETIDRMLDIMPSKRLIIHQYKKHGTCSGLSVDTYFEVSRNLFSKVVIPGAYKEPRSPIETTPEAVEEAFLRANPKLRPEMISVSCARRERLREIRICFSREGEFRSCGRNEEQERLCSAKKLTLPPVRGKGGGSSSI
jgi:ribonuclease T2